MIRALRLAGRCANGFERGRGITYHAVETGAAHALCGARPGRLSAGWSDQPGDAVTCARCLKAEKRTRQAGASAELGGVVATVEALAACGEKLMRELLDQVVEAMEADKVYRQAIAQGRVLRAIVPRIETRKSGGPLTGSREVRCIIWRVALDIGWIDFSHGITESDVKYDNHEDC